MSPDDIKGAADDGDFFDEPESEEGPLPPLTLPPESVRHLTPADVRAMLQMESRRPRRNHEPLPFELQQMVNRRIRVRLAGFNGAGNKIHPKDDIEVYQDLEYPTVSWRDRVIENASLDEPKDRFGLNKKQYEAIAHFHNNGGHASRLNQQQIEHVLKHGTIAFVEYVGENGACLPLASVSTLMPIPCSIKKRDAKKHVFPNLDIRQLLFPTDELLEENINRAPHTIALYRSTVREKISIEVLQAERTGQSFLDDNRGKIPKELIGLSLRRLGLAARGKFELFKLALDVGFSDVNFNIGTLKSPNEQQIEKGTNRPSQAHNSWAQAAEWRTVEAMTDIIPNVVRMYWRAYRQSLSEGLKGVSLILREKEWNMNIVGKSAHDNIVRFANDLPPHGRHASIMPYHKHFYPVVPRPKIADTPDADQS